MTEYPEECSCSRVSLNKSAQRENAPGPARSWRKDCQAHGLESSWLFDSEEGRDFQRKLFVFPWDIEILEEARQRYRSAHGTE